jgi:hypothetical protein
MTTIEQRNEISIEIRKRLAAAKKFVTLDRWHRYKVMTAPERWSVFKGVTSVNGVIDKSRPLTKWAADSQLEADEEVAWQMYSESLPVGLTRATFRALFTGKANGAKAYLKKLHEASDLGTQVHDLIEHRLRTSLDLPAEEPVVSDMALFVYAGMEAWMARVELEPVAMEFAVFSLTHLYAGTGDCLAWLRLPERTVLRVVDHKPVWRTLPAWPGHRLVLLDWKTAKGIYSEMYLQNAAYRSAATEMGIFKGLLPDPVSGLLVRLPKTESELEFSAEFEEAECDPEDDATLMKVFIAAGDIFPWKKEEDDKGLELWKAKKNGMERLLPKGSHEGPGGA